MQAYVYPQVQIHSNTLAVKLRPRSVASSALAVKIAPFAVRARAKFQCERVRSSTASVRLHLKVQIRSISLAVPLRRTPPARSVLGQSRILIETSISCLLCCILCAALLLLPLLLLPLLQHHLAHHASHHHACPFLSSNPNQFPNLLPEPLPSPQPALCCPVLSPALPTLTSTVPSCSWDFPYPPEHPFIPVLPPAPHTRHTRRGSPWQSPCCTYPVPLLPALATCTCAVHLHPTLTISSRWVSPVPTGHPARDRFPRFPSRPPRRHRVGHAHCADPRPRCLGFTILHPCNFS